MTAEPFLRWVGGKRQLLPAILPHVPKDITTYHEPFLGGGALFFAIASAAVPYGRANREPLYVLSDINHDLVQAYQAVKRSPVPVLGALRRFPTDPETYARVRADAAGECFGQFTTIPHLRGLRLIYLNRTCFNGLYRENARGQFNVPYGRAFDFAADWFRDNVLQASTALRNAYIERRPFDVPVIEPGRGAFVYCDPPYVPLTATSNFTSYNAKGFGWEQQVALRNQAVRWAKAGARVLLSNSGSPLVRELYAGVGEILGVTVSRRVAASGAARGKVKEVLIKVGYA